MDEGREAWEFRRDTHYKRRGRRLVGVLAVLTGYGTCPVRQLTIIRVRMYIKTPINGVMGGKRRRWILLQVMAKGVKIRLSA